MRSGCDTTTPHAPHIEASVGTLSESAAGVVACVGGGPGAFMQNNMHARCLRATGVWAKTTARHR